MKSIIQSLTIILILLLFSYSKGDTCPEGQISVKPLGDGCQTIESIVEDENLVIDTIDLLYLASKNKGIIEKDDYKLEIFKLNDKKLQSQSYRKSKLYIPESCMSAMEEDEKIKLDRTKGVVIISYNYNKVNQNNLPEIHFVIRHNGDNSQVKFINSKTFDLSLCHKEPIYLDQQISVTDLRYDLEDDTPINFEKIIYCRKRKIDLFDPHSDFLNDICFRFTSEGNTDVTLDSRLEDYYQNITLCNESLSSHYIGFNYSSTSNSLTYRCAYGFYESEEEKFSYIDDIDAKMKFLFSSSNIKVIACYKDLLNLKNAFYNYGGLICIFIFIVQIILYIDYCRKGTKPLEDRIDVFIGGAEVKEYHRRLTKEYNDMQMRANNVNSENRLNNQYTTNEYEIENYDSQNWQNGGQNIYNPNGSTGIYQGNPPRNNNNQKNSNFVIVGNDNIDDIKKKKAQNKKKKGKAPKKNKKEEDLKSDISHNYDLVDDEKNDYPYEKAVEKDKRTFWQYYWSILKVGHIILNLLFYSDDFNILSVKIGLLLMLFPLNLTFNSLFYTSKNIKEVYLKKVEDLSTIFNNIVNTFISSILSTVLFILLKVLCLTHSSIKGLRKIKNLVEAKAKKKGVLKILKIRIFLYYFLSLTFLIVFGYYIACFCLIFKNTQIDLISSMFSSWALSLVYPIFIYIITAIFRITALKYQSKCLYFINRIMQHF